jgi:hypothetical protein
MVRPEHVHIKPGEQAAFTCSALDQYGQPFATPAVAWSATAGSITPNGLYTAGATGGLHSVRAEVGGREALAEVRVRSEEESGDDERGEETVPPGKQRIRWRGNVPPQKWMNLYTKVLTRFAASPDLKLEVSFDVQLDGEQAQSKVDEARSGLKELGLDDNVILG